MFDSAIVKFRILFWCASATLLLFSYFIEKKKSQTSEISGFLFYSTLLTFIILFDDFFLIHHFFRKVLHIKNTFFYLIYPVITVAIIKFYYKEIAERLNLSSKQVENIVNDILRKKRTTEYLRHEPI